MEGSRASTPSARPAKAVAALLALTGVAVAPPLWTALFEVIEDQQLAARVAPQWGLTAALLTGALALALLPPRRWVLRAGAVALGCCALLWLELGYRGLIVVAGSDAALERAAFLADHATRPEDEQVLGHPFLHYTGNPAADRYNERGFPDRTHTVEKPPGTVRVACLGGSTTASGYPQELELLLNEHAVAGRRYEVLNFGLEGWTVLHSLVNFAVQGVDYQPDVVVVHHAANDAIIMSTPTPCSDYSHALAPYAFVPPSPAEAWLLAHSLVFQGMWTHLIQRNSLAPRPTPLAQGAYDEEPTPRCTQIPDWHPGDFTIFERHLEALAFMARSHGAIVVLTTMPSDSHRPEGNEALVKANEVVRGVASRGGPDLLLVDLDRELGRPLEPHFKDDLHLDLEGRRMKATSIARAILGALPEPPPQLEPPAEPPTEATADPGSPPPGG